MKPVKPPRINGRVPVLSAQEAVNYIPDEATLCVLGAGGEEEWNNKSRCQYGKSV